MAQRADSTPDDWQTIRAAPVVAGLLVTFVLLRTAGGPVLSAAEKGVQRAAPAALPFERDHVRVRVEYVYMRFADFPEIVRRTAWRPWLLSRGGQRGRLSKTIVALSLAI